jgi:hypothetical protein
MYLATDTWPFLYMQKPMIPKMYIWIMLMFIASGVLGVVFTGHARGGTIRSQGVFALMGAAFLLLETKSVIQFSLLFGATWLVNSLVFFAILVSVLLANWTIVYVNVKRPAILFMLLLASLVVQYIVPLESLLEIGNREFRYVVASAMFFAPIFFANLVFGYLFKGTDKSATSFGWNIIGTMIGGALEYASLAIGYKSLTLVVLALYGLCFVLAQKSLHNAGPEQDVATDTHMDKRELSWSVH